MGSIPDLYGGTAGASRGTVDHLYETVCAQLRDAQDQLDRLRNALEGEIAACRSNFESLEAVSDALEEAGVQPTGTAADGVRALAEDKERLDKLERWLTEDPTRFQIAVRRLEGTSEFLVKAYLDMGRLTPQPSGRGDTLRAAIDDCAALALKPAQPKPAM